MADKNADGVKGVKDKTEGTLLQGRVQDRIPDLCTHVQ
jgi:hypothetical protein